MIPQKELIEFTTNKVKGRVPISFLICTSCGYQIVTQEQSEVNKHEIAKFKDSSVRK